MDGDVNNRQVGGEHYRSKFQHWDLIEGHGLGYLEGCATKYPTRHRSKNGLQDLHKSEHYLDKLISLYSAGRRNMGWCTADTVAAFGEANNLTRLETNYITAVCLWKTPEDLEQARVLLHQVIAEAEEAQASHDPGQG